MDPVPWSAAMQKPGPRILVVEDEIAIQRGLCDVLAYRGYAPTGVATGRGCEACTAA
jgi:CheY-like chemotaxis protein